MEVLENQTGIYKRTVKMELERTKNYFGPGAAYDTIKRFATDLKVKDGLSDHRIMFYFAKLRPIAKTLGDKFLDPGEDDLKAMIEDLSHSKVSPRSIEDYKQTLKKFYSWLLPKAKYNRACGWIKIKNNVDRLKKSEDMLTEDEVNVIIANCKNLRDKALVSLAYDSGCRVGELLTVRLRDLELDDKGLTLHVAGKTGERTVYVIGDSIAYVREWRKIHPETNRPDALLFVDLVTGKGMNYDSARITIQKAVKRSKINKRVHLHLFRHSYATRYSEVLSESVLKAQLGWTASSKMAQKYVHLSGQQQKNAILKANGFEPEVKTIKKVQLRSCQRCGEKNPSTASYCLKCWFPLTTEAAIELKEKQDHIEKSMNDKGLISPQVQAVLKAMPEHEKTGLLATIVDGLIKEQGSKDKNKLPS